MDFTKGKQIPVEREKYLEVKGLQVEYKGKNERVTALKSIDLSLDKGEIGVIIGPSGCGKSTLLHVLAGIKQDYCGQVTINGKPPAHNKEIALILQDYGLLPWKTVWQNVTLGMELRKLPKEELMLGAKKILQQLALEQLAERYPARLSGGQRQRVAIARALALKPELLLMDEPFSSLDALTREEMQDLLLSIWKEKRISIVLVTHAIEEAVFLGHTIFVMPSLPGTIIAKVNNQLAGDSSLRGKREFYEMCTYLRSLLHRRENIDQAKLSV